MQASAAVRAAVQRHAETTRLMGVDFLPVSGTLAPPDQAPDVSVEAKPVAAPDDAGRTARRAAKQAALDTLRARYERESPLVKEMPGWTKIVFADGDPDAQLMFVGEAPGADEDRTGIPFVGRAGQKLNEMIKAMGFPRESVYIANILKVRPPDNRTPTPDEAAKDGPFLKEQITIVQPRAIVTLGKPAAQFLLETRESMSALRGRWFTYQGIPVMPTFHPAFLLRQYTPENRAKVWSDLKQVIARLKQA